MDAFGEGESACHYVGYLVMDAFGEVSLHVIM